MTVSQDINRVEPLVIATVPAPVRTVAAGPQAREEALRHLLQTAGEYGVGMVATRPEGDAERELGQAWPFPSPFRVTVKTVSIEDGVDRVEARARRSLDRMGLPRGDTLLVSRASDLAGSEGRALWNRLQDLKSRGIYRRIGICAELEDGPDLLARRFQPDVMQLSCSLLDQRPAQTGLLDSLAAQDVEVHCNAVFAHGALFAERHALPPHLAAHGAERSRIRLRLAECRVDPMQAALAYALSLPTAPRLVASVATAAEMRAIVAAAHAPAPQLDWSAFALKEPAILTAGLSAIERAA